MVRRGQKYFKDLDEVGRSRDYFSISKTGFGPLMKEMGAAYCKEARRRAIKNLEVDGIIISNK